MKGLILKDVQLLKSNSRSMLVLIALAVMIMFQGGVEQMNGAVAYLTFICGMLAISTLSYDEFDKSDMFLMTLPITREMYALGKYVFAFLITFSGWLAGVLLTIFFYISSPGDTVLSELMGSLVVIYFVIYLMIAIMIPLQLKFGQTNSRIVMLAVVLVITVVGYGLKSMAKRLHINTDVLAALVTQKLNQLFMNGNVFVLILVGVALELLAVFVSYLFSRKIVMDREY